MNRAITRLFVVVIALFALLVFFTSRTTVFDQSSLKANSFNRLAFYQSWKVKRGRIFADDGTVLAKSVKAPNGLWSRKYPFGSLFSQAVGYANIEEGQQAGLEKSQAAALSGRSTGITSVLGLQAGQPAVGNDVYSTLDPAAQNNAQQLLDGTIHQTGATAGSVVAIVPQTGAVKVMYSWPNSNDNDPFAPCHPKGSACQLNWATQAGLPPGSTFKVVTTTAALDTGKYTPDSIINGDSPIIISGRPLENDDNYSYGDVSLTRALTDSINTVYAQVGESVGASNMQTYMERFGFYANLIPDYPGEQQLWSGERIDGKLVPVTNPNVDLGRTAIGQANLSVTPFQMAMVVSAVADDGKLMTPHLVSKIVNQDGQVIQDVNPTVQDQVMKPQVATEIQAMMRDVVEEGTGTSANLEGLPIAGKTGTATTGGCSRGVFVVADGDCTEGGVPLDDAWFIGFPEQDPKIAVAVELSDIPNGYGGTYAAPIAAKIIKQLLGEGY
jgi:peptidoglycan glycosyltransferase